MGRIRDLEFFSTTRNDRIFLFPSALQETYIGINSCIIVDYIRKQSNIALWLSSKKIFLGRFRVLEYFSTTRNDRIFLFHQALQETYISLKPSILVDYTRKHPKVCFPISSKKIFWVGFGFSNFYRLLETTDFFFLVFLKRLMSVSSYVFQLITQENPQKFVYQYPQKKLFGSVSGFRIIFDYSKRPNFSFS